MTTIKMAAVALFVFSSAVVSAFSLDEISEYTNPKPHDLSEKALREVTDQLPAGYAETCRWTDIIQYNSPTVVCEPIGVCGLNHAVPRTHKTKSNKYVWVIINPKCD